MFPALGGVYFCLVNNKISTDSPNISDAFKSEYR